MKRKSIFNPSEITMIEVDVRRWAAHAVERGQVSDTKCIHTDKWNPNPLRDSRFRTPFWKKEGMLIKRLQDALGKIERYKHEYKSEITGKLIMMRELVKKSWYEDIGTVYVLSLEVRNLWEKENGK